MPTSRPQDRSRSILPFRRPTPAAISASHRKSFHPPETAESPRRSTHKPAPAPPPAPPPHETLATPAADETAQFPPDSAWPSPRSTHSPAPPHPSPAAAAASAPLPRPQPIHSPQSSPQPAAVSQDPPCTHAKNSAAHSTFVPPASAVIVISTGKNAFLGPVGGTVSRVRSPSKKFRPPTMTATTPQAQKPPAHAGIFQLLNGIAVAGALSGLAQLAIPDLVEHGPKSADELAREVGADPRA